MSRRYNIFPGPNLKKKKEKEKEKEREKRKERGKIKKKIRRIIIRGNNHKI